MLKEKGNRRGSHTKDENLGFLKSGAVSWVMVTEPRAVEN
jgi:hypothetical protein